MCLIEAQICAADSSFSFLRLSHKSPYRFEDPSCAFGAALLQGPTQLACWTFSHPMRQFLNAFPLREGGGQRPGWMCLIEAQICAADSSFSFLRLSHKPPYRFEDPSSAFGAPLLQGVPTSGLSHFRFRTAAWIHPAPLARPFSKGYSVSTLNVFSPYETVLKRVPP